MCCSMLQCVAVCCSLLQSVAALSLFRRETTLNDAVCCSVLQHVAACCFDGIQGFSDGIHRSFDRVEDFFEKNGV